MEKKETKDSVRIGFGEFNFEMSGDFVKENGRILAIGAVFCGVIIAGGVTYAITRNPGVAKEVAGKVAQFAPKVV
ncbi:hypothetical protein QGM71_12195 [Virgibacillus sp. C22-A2]|uniref:Class IIb bacteriocin, lactobin A/cerein 7B family n=1 Tax=Virgibacillus tibetensis TaxID=3042313 RepID=A0ABU6KG11_9BACI|nr:hypothetical protein [Virgibacillus sp. C22-A2]